MTISSILFAFNSMQYSLFTLLLFSTSFFFISSLMYYLRRNTCPLSIMRLMLKTWNHWEKTKIWNQKLENMALCNLLLEVNMKRLFFESLLNVEYWRDFYHWIWVRCRHVLIMHKAWSILARLSYYTSYQNIELFNCWYSLISNLPSSILHLESLNFSFEAKNCCFYSSIFTF